MKKMYVWMLAATLTFCGAMMMLTSCTDAISSMDNPVPVNPKPQELADYTIIYYGHGGNPSLDIYILQRICNNCMPPKQPPTTKSELLWNISSAVRKLSIIR